MNAGSPTGPIDGYPLFPLGNVLLPSENTALHIFEERYKELAARCLENDETFGFVLADDRGAPQEFGCAARIVDVLERYDDGRLDILVRGERPLRVIEADEAFAYPAGRVEFPADEPQEPGEKRQAELARKAFTSLVEASGAEGYDPAQIAGMDAYGMAARVTLENEQKQALLEMRAEADRLSLLERVFAEAAQAAAVARRIEVIANTNGHAIR